MKAVLPTRSSRSRVRYSLLLFSLLAVGTPHLFAQPSGQDTAGYTAEAGQPSSALPGALRGIGFDQNLGHRLPLDAVFSDEEGHQVRLGEYFGSRPVVLVFAYYECPMLCTQVLNATARSLNVLSLEPGQDFGIVTISIDPREKPALATAKKRTYVKQYKRPGAASAWHFLTGDQPAIDRVTKAAGFRYRWDDKLQLFAHPAGIVVVTPEGQLSRYLFGLDYGPRDLRLALVEASSNQVGSPVDSFLLYCYHYDPMTGRYGLVIMRVLRTAAAGTVLALGLFVGLMLRRERRDRGPQKDSFPGRQGGHS